MFLYISLLYFVLLSENNIKYNNNMQHVYIAVHAIEFVCKGDIKVPLLLKNFYNATKNKYKLKLICGEHGLCQEVSWVYYSEDLHTTNYIRNGNLVITTGMIINSEKNLKKFICEIIHRNTAGLFINIGHYLQETDINRDIIEYCNAHNYPLFVFPWEIHIADIMQDYLNRIVLGQHYEESLTKAFINLIHRPDREELYKEEIGSSSFMQVKNYCIICFSPHNKQIAPESRELILLQGRNAMNTYNTPYLFFPYFYYYILIISDSMCKNIENIVTILENIFLHESQACRIGISNSVSKLTELSESYKQAIGAVTIAAVRQVSPLYFEKLGIYQLLLSIEDKRILHQFSNIRLSILAEYDRVHNTALSATLKIYLENSCSLQSVAEQTFLHRNTINYRMKQIRQLLPVDFSNATTRMEY